MCRMAYMCMVTAFIENMQRKMTIVMPRVHENITRIILAGTVSCGSSIYTSRASKLVLVDIFLKKCHSTIHYMYGTNTEAQCPLANIDLVVGVIDGSPP